MDRLFASLSGDEPAYRRIPLRTGLLFTLVSAFIAGAEMVRISELVRDRGARQDLVLELAFLALWLAIALRVGARGVGVVETASDRDGTRRYRMNLRH